MNSFFRFRSQSTMNAQNHIHYVAQECMALTKNPFQFRLTPFDKQQDSESNSDAEETALEDEVDKAELSKESVSREASVNKSDGDKSASSREAVKESECQPSTSKEPDLDEDSDFKKGIKIDVFCKENFYLCYFWGVNIDQFHNFMRLNSQSFNDRLLDGTLFDQAYLERNTPKL